MVKAALYYCIWAALGAACAHSGPAQKIELDPMVITAGQDGPGKGAEELFDDGRTFFRAGQFAKAAERFDRVLSEFPKSDFAAPALYDSALAHEQLGHFTESLDRLTALLQREPANIDAQFHAALSEYKLGKKDAAAARLQMLAGRNDLSRVQRADALTQEAVCRVELGDGEAGEKLLRAALEAMGDESTPALVGKAEFWLGEVYRGRFRDSPIDPIAMSSDALEKALNLKSELLLSAQGHYLRAVEKGEGEWATAAGYRVGELYESFHDELVKAPLPPGLDEDQQALYRSELRERVRALLGKALRIYEQTLDTARKTAATNEYVDKARAALERVRALLLADRPSL